MGSPERVVRPQSLTCPRAPPSIYRSRTWCAHTAAQFARGELTCAKLRPVAISMTTRASATVEPLLFSLREGALPVGGGALEGTQSTRLRLRVVRPAWSCVYNLNALA